MCGIVGITAKREVAPMLINGLKALEYRGYDSAGIAVLNQHGFDICKELGKVSVLESRVQQAPPKGYCGIGHTRWATHGKPSEENAHPHTSHGSIAVVHNGIIENHSLLREKLLANHYDFHSDTDTEIIAHLIHWQMSKGESFAQACLSAIRQLEGAYALAITCASEPGRIIATRKGSPLIIGEGSGEYFVASDIPAILAEVEQYYYLEEGDVADLTADSCKIFDEQGRVVERVVNYVEQTAEVHSKGRYEHYMLKEIHEQPKVVRDTMTDVLNTEGFAETFIHGELAEKLAQAQCVHIIACGSSWHAGCVAKYWLESFAQIPCSVEIASEYRYRKPVVPEHAVFIAISQSGETADTLAAMRYAKENDYAATLSICNVANSTMDRESDFTLMTKAGVEIGVASTKAFTAQLVVLAMLVLRVAQLKGMDTECIADAQQQLRQLPEAIENALSLNPQIATMALRLYAFQNILFLGRGHHAPIASEGALKLKEISYIHAEAYAAGELKHGPLALIDHNMPVIALCPCGELLEKVKANLEEVRARGGQLFILTDDGVVRGTYGKEDFRLRLNLPGSFVSPIIYNIPLQLLAYHVAYLRGTDIDQPRNLAKSVTVE